MKSELLIVNPYSDDIKKLLEFEQVHNLPPIGSESLKNIQSHYSKEEYNQTIPHQNTISQVIARIEKNEIKDYAFLQGERDTKFATIEFIPMTKKYHSRKLIDMIMDYTTNHLGMKAVAVLQKKEDISLGMLLEEREFESLGEEFGSIVYLMDPEEKKERETIICAV